MEAGGRELVPGLIGTVIGPGGVRVGFVVLSVDQANRTWLWRAHWGPASLTLHHAVIERPTGGTIAVLELVGSAPVVLAYLAPARWALRSLVQP